MKLRRSPHYHLGHVDDEVEWEHDAWHVYEVGNAGSIHGKLLHARWTLCVSGPHERSPVGKFNKCSKKCE